MEKNVFDFEHIGDKSLQGHAGRRKMRDSKTQQTKLSVEEGGQQ